MGCSQSEPASGTRIQSEYSWASRVKEVRGDQSFLGVRVAPLKPQLDCISSPREAGGGMGMQPEGPRHQDAPHVRPASLAHVFLHHLFSTLFEHHLSCRKTSVPC